MIDERQRERRQTLLIILAALIVAIACWAPIGFRMFFAPTEPAALPVESSDMTAKD